MVHNYPCLVLKMKRYMGFFSYPSTQSSIQYNLKILQKATPITVYLLDIKPPLAVQLKDI